MARRYIVGHWDRRVVGEVVESGGSGVGYRRSIAGMIDLVRVEGFVGETGEIVVDSRMVVEVHTEKCAVEERAPCCSISRGQGAHALALAKMGSFDPLQSREMVLK